MGLFSGSLPGGHQLPEEFLSFVDAGCAVNEPWTILSDESADERYQGLSERYPGRGYVPFARRLDNDDVACVVMYPSKGGVVIVHDFASPGWQERESFAGVVQWLHRTIDDFAQHALLN